MNIRLVNIKVKKGKLLGVVVSVNSFDVSPTQTSMGVRVTPNGFEGRDLTEGIGINNSYDRFENFVKQKMYEME